MAHDLTIVVGISVYRQPLNWVLRCIDSVVSQSWCDWKLIIRLDGPSAMDPKDIVSLQRHIENNSGIELLQGISQVGCFSSYKIIFSTCDSPYLCQLDADDMLAPTALEDSVNTLISYPSAPFSYSYSGLLSDNDDVYGLDERALTPWSSTVELTRFITFHFRLVRSCFYFQAGGYLDDYLYAGDYDLCLRLAELGQPILIPKILYLYRVHGLSASQTSKTATYHEATRAARSALVRRKDTHSLLLTATQDFQLESLDDFRGPILVSGFHRSGTSLMCRLLTCFGVAFPGSLLEPDLDNVTGYYECTSFVYLHQQWFSTLPGDHWSDWGLSSSNPVSPLGRFEWKEQAKLFISRIDSLDDHKVDSSKNSYWALKDPRCTMLLPFWRDVCRHSLLVLGVFRAPWDSSDALMRITNSLFRQRPELILSSWLAYNESLLNYAVSYPHSCFLVASDRLLDPPNQLLTVLNQRWDLNLQYNDLRDDLFKSSSLRGSRDSESLARLYAMVYPRISDAFNNLNSIADLPSSSSNLSFNPLNSDASPDCALNFSIIIPTYNPCHFLLEAIASAESAVGDASAELIIVDDGSDSYDSLSLLKALRDGGYCVISQCNKGLSSARNLGFVHARAPYIVPLDDDNRLLSPYFKLGVHLLESDPALGWIYGNQINFGADSSAHYPGDFDPIRLCHQNYIDACSLVRKSMWQSIGGYDCEISALSDWDFWLNATSAGFLGRYLEIDCFEYRVRENSMLRNHLANEVEHQDAVDFLRAKYLAKIQDLNI